MSQPSREAERWPEAVRYLQIGCSVVVYCLASAAVPIYSKMVFDGKLHTADGTPLKKFPYPLATAFIQLGVVACFLNAYSVLAHMAKCLSGGRVSDSWLFGPHFMYKLRHIAPVGLLFGLKYGITNWGLKLVPTGMHLLLQSTDLLWTALTARLINKEKLGYAEVLAVICSTAGSVMIALHAVDTVEAPALALAVNLLTPLMLALCVSTMRLGARELFRPDNCLEGSMTKAEFTGIKLTLSASVALSLAFLLEGPAGDKMAWWEALSAQPEEGVVLMLLGGLFVLIFQVNLTWLASLTSAVTMAIVSGLKVVPQWLLNAAFNLKVDITFLNLSGAILVLSATMLYAWASYKKKQRREQLPVSVREQLTKGES
eukprot:TRINITY_DN26016_c0_g1_i1.p1 TRINITY_DN26016_c0_g1~~TRINITY_DN26016_c0_g1_i1.p1  ORF type:complete len:372 (+),score=76.77 TRINITY_DN26016_c0_g1_i1:87-1202(+)